MNTPPPFLINNIEWLAVVSSSVPSVMSFSLSLSLAVNGEQQFFFLFTRRQIAVEFCLGSNRDTRM